MALCVALIPDCPFPLRIFCPFPPDPLFFSIGIVARPGLRVLGATRPMSRAPVLHGEPGKITYVNAPASRAMGVLLL